MNQPHQPTPPQTRVRDSRHLRSQTTTAPQRSVGGNQQIRPSRSSRQPSLHRASWSLLDQFTPTHLTKPAHATAGTLRTPLTAGSARQTPKADAHRPNRTRASQTRRTPSRTSAARHRRLGLGSARLDPRRSPSPPPAGSAPAQHDSIPDDRRRLHPPARPRPSTTRSPTIAVASTRRLGPGPARLDPRRSPSPPPAVGSAPAQPNLISAIVASACRLTAGHAGRVREEETLTS